MRLHIIAITSFCVIFGVQLFDFWQKKCGSLDSTFEKKKIKMNPFIFIYSVFLVFNIMLTPLKSNPVSKLKATPSKLFNFSVEQKNIKINRNISKLFHTILLNTSETQFDTSFLYFTRSQANLKSSATKSCLLLLHEPLILFTARGVLINAYGEKL